MGIYRFFKGMKGWYVKQEKIAVPQDIIVQDADEILKIAGVGKDQVEMQMEIYHFKKAGILELTRLNNTAPGGGYYRWYNHRNKLIKKDLWLCDLPLVLFGDIPEKIFIKIINSHS